jgi:hypothetical protein
LEYQRATSMYSGNPDILHFTGCSYCEIQRYKVYATNYPSSGVDIESARIIKNAIRHYILQPFTEDYLEATSLVVEDRNGPSTLSAVYKPSFYQMLIGKLQLQITLQCSTTDLPQEITTTPKTHFGEQEL